PRHLHSFPTRRSSDLRIPHPTRRGAAVHRVSPSGTPPSSRSIIPLSGGMLRGDELLDPGPPPGEFLFRLTMVRGHAPQEIRLGLDRKSTRLNSSHVSI